MMTTIPKTMYKNPAISDNQLNIINQKYKK